MSPPEGLIPFGEVRAWMFQEALPFWGSAGVDEKGGFREELALDGRPTDVPFKRVRTICRQVYVFSHAALLGWDPGRALSTMGYEFLVKHAWLGPDRGWAKLLSRDGEAIDPTPDLYDLAFVQFALAWRYRLTGEAEVLEKIRKTHHFIKAHLGAGALGGYWHQVPPTGPRLQNPHMHLLESFLAIADAGGGESYVEAAGEIVDLFQTRFFDGRTLGEYFTDDLRRVAGEPGRSVEPGHQFEWAWILAQYHRLSGRDVTKEALGLTEFGELCVDAARGAVPDEVRDDGMVLRSGSRTWPNTERIKAHLGLFELIGKDPRAAVNGSVRLLLGRYLTNCPKGSWIDRFDAQGRPIATAAPASTFYHLFLAFAEVLRLEPALLALPEAPVMRDKPDERDKSDRT